MRKNRHISCFAVFPFINQKTACDVPLEDWPNNRRDLSVLHEGSSELRTMLPALHNVPGWIERSLMISLLSVSKVVEQEKGKENRNREGKISRNGERKLGEIESVKN